MTGPAGGGRDDGRGVWTGVARSVELVVPTLSEIRDLRPLVPPLLVGWVATVLAAWMTVPLVEIAVSGDAIQAAPVIRLWMWVMAALAPLFQMGRALLWVAAGWALLTLASRAAPFRTLLSVFLYGEVIVALYGVLLALFFQWSVQPGSAGATFLDPLSLAPYVPSSHGPWDGLAKQLSLVQAAWVVYVGLAGRRVLGLGVWGGWTLAGVLWLGTVGLAAAKIFLNG